MNNEGTLTVVGTGILTPAHLSQESIASIKHADVVHVLVPDPLGLSTIKQLNQNIKNLADLYFDSEICEQTVFGGYRRQHLGIKTFLLCFFNTNMGRIDEYAGVPVENSTNFLMTSNIF